MPTSDELRATIARARNRAADDFYFPTDPDFLLILDAAERDVEWNGLTMTARKVKMVMQAQQVARNAALEEAAKVADRLAIHASDADLQSDDDSDCYGAGYNCGACEYGVQIAEEIRALKEPT